MSNLHEGYELVKSISIQNLLAQRDGIASRLRQVRALFLEADAIGNQIGLFNDVVRYGLAKVVNGPSSRYCYELPLNSDEALSAALKRLDAAGWNLLMHESGLKSLMDAKAREEWQSKIDKCEVPPLTVENITATFEGLHDARGDMFERGVINCFKRLAWCYRTNQPQKFGKRIVKRVRSYGNVSSECMDELEDLQRVFSVLDGKPEEDRRHGLYQRLYDAERLPGERYGRKSQFTLDDTYMSFRVFKNGNAHITFKRADLVDQLNRIIAKHYPGCLPAPKGVA